MENMATEAGNWDTRREFPKGVMNGHGGGDRFTYPEALANGYIKNGKITCPPAHGHRIIKNACTSTNVNGIFKRDETKTPKKQSFEGPGIITIFFCELGFMLLMVLGFFSQFLFPHKRIIEKNRAGYPSLYKKEVTFFSHYLYRRIQDCWNYPICSVPGNEVVLKERVTDDCGWSFRFTGGKMKCLNLGSYNYLGFAENKGPCAEAVIEAIYKYGLSTCSSRQNYGTCDLHRELESLTAEFLGTEDAVTFGMGFATNALSIPTLLTPGCLVVSDNKNHASLILGIRISGATVRVFRHNDLRHLERTLAEAIVEGQPKCREHTPWKKILIIVEGVYSMEGSIVNLPELIRLKKKYKAYLYLDEAHSIGAMGRHGKGIVDFYRCDPRDIDILMGTFTKSFGSAGGYIAGNKELIAHIRKHSTGYKYAFAMSPPVAAQIIAVLKILLGKDGTDEGKKRIEQLARNTIYFRKRLAQMGLIVYGHENSPVVPILVYMFSKITAMVRTLYQYKIATVGVGYPATPLREGRIRVCLSAAHTKEQLDYALDCIQKMSMELGLVYSKNPIDIKPIDYDSIKVYE